MKNLPPKEEWVLMVKMSEFQRKMYNMFMENLQLDAESCIGGTNPLKAFAVACKVSIFLRTNVCGVDMFGILKYFNLH